MTSFKQTDEKHVSVEVELMLWSPKFDLVALSNVQGEVVLHRWSWQKVWSVAPPSEETKVKALAWRPDGKVLAAGYTCGVINLYDIENSEVLHNLELQGGITCMSWIAHTPTDGSTWSTDPYIDDNSEVYLPKLQPLSKSYGSLTKGTPVEENVEDSKKLKDQKELNLLVVGCSNNDLHLFAYGVFPISATAAPSVCDSQLQSICSAEISQDLQIVSLVVEIKNESSDQREFHMLRLDTRLIASRQKELRLLALKCGQIATLIAYLQTTIQQMSEAWEDILMEMDSKLKKFADEKRITGTSTVSNDFLELLMFGTPSNELQTFLLHELTEKGLKKLGHSIETSYSNIQKLVVKHLQVVSQAILYHLSDLRGMSMLFDKFGVLGLKTPSVQEAVTAVGSFILKTSEIQQVIDDSIKNFKAFFRWLYLVILRLSNEKPPAELNMMTQHDINFVAEFLTDNFDHFTLEEEDSIADLTDDGRGKAGFKLEKVGQYLKKEDLHYPPTISGNPWIQFQRGCFHLKDTQIMYPMENDKSLVQLQDKLENCIKSTLTRPSFVIGQSFACLSSLHLFTNSENKEQPLLPKICQFTSNEKGILYTVFTTESLPSEKLTILRQPTSSNSTQISLEAVTVQVGGITYSSSNSSLEESMERCSHHRIQDIAFYDEKTLSLLLIEDGEDEVPILVQLPLVVIADSNFVSVPSGGNIQQANLKTVDVGSLLESNCCRRLENMKAHSFSVSGTRKTATVLFSSKRRVRIFLMDAEEEDDEDDDEIDDSVNQTTEGDVSGAPAGDMQVDEDEEETSEGQEDKENLSLINQTDQSAD